MRSLPALLAAALAAPATAQVVISEVQFDGSPNDSAWIELRNAGAAKVDLTGWSLYYTCRVAGTPGTYWWGFPAATELEPDAYLRVHWFKQFQTPTKTDLFTGTSIYHFLFGYGGAPLNVDDGALALLSTTQNLLINDPVHCQDWISWGGGNHQRESIAAAAGKWVLGQFVPKTTPGETIALAYGHGEPTPLDAFFQDTTPTPNKHNHPGGSRAFDSATCTNGSFVTELQVPVFPAAGAKGFRFVMTGTDPNYPTQAAVLWLGAPGLLPLPGRCQLDVDPATGVGLVVSPVTGPTAEFPITIPETLPLGSAVAAQGMLLDLSAPLVEYALTQRARLGLGK